ncbi:hypothetical protein AVEN_103379-1 [Araneus ventricosus]|uniref:Uncharacterized protein n=1 Tax=Araneus ventricosus TaxID=182803 RepID=A0A4Y2PIM2_ARAVE|nr:hypothetical protein AVEN_103379-1 [Araneus ventricosus]
MLPWCHSPHQWQAPRVEQGHRCLGLGQWGVSAHHRQAYDPSTYQNPGSDPGIALCWDHQALPRGLVSDHPWGFHVWPLVRRAGQPVRQVVCWGPFGCEHPV